MNPGKHQNSKQKGHARFRMEGPRPYASFVFHTYTMHELDVLGLRLPELSYLFYPTTHLNIFTSINLEMKYLEYTHLVWG